MTSTLTKERFIKRAFNESLNSVKKRFFFSIFSALWIVCFIFLINCHIQNVMLFQHERLFPTGWFPFQTSSPTTSLQLLLQTLRALWGFVSAEGSPQINILFHSHCMQLPSFILSCTGVGMGLLEPITAIFWQRRGIPLYRWRGQIERHTTICALTCTHTCCQHLRKKLRSKASATVLFEHLSK